MTVWKNTIGCNKCKGSGKIKEKDKFITCPYCHGSGDGYVVDMSGFENVKLNVKC